MKRNLTFVSLLAVLVIAMGFSSALGTIESVKFNGVELAGTNSVIAANPGDVVPVWVQFVANSDDSNVIVEAEIKGRNGVSTSEEISDIENGSTYPVLLKLRLPEYDDQLTMEYTLWVTVSSNTEDVVEKFDFSLRVQRNSYNIKVLSVDYNPKASAGNVFPVSVVMKNIGYNRLDDVYVIASIPALGVTARGYAGDLIPAEDYIDYENEEDSVEKVVYLKVPEGAQSGVYELTVEVYNHKGDSSYEISKLLSVDGVKPEEKGNDEVLSGDEEPGMSTSVVALTVILVIIFVVLLAVLVVLLTKKEKPMEEVETSYY